MGRSKKKARLAELPPEEEDDFQVEYFKAARVGEEGEWQYLVKWFGYDNPEEDTWEPSENIAECQRLLGSFWGDIGHDNDDYQPGFECRPSAAWIKKEIAWFAAHSNDAKRKKRIEQQKAREAEQERLREEKRKKQMNTKAAVAKKSQRASSSASVDIRVRKSVQDSNSGTITGKRRRSVGADSSSSSDTPLGDKISSISTKGKKKKTKKVITLPTSQEQTPAPVGPASLFDDDEHKQVPPTEDPATLFAPDAKTNTQRPSPLSSAAAGPSLPVVRTAPPQLDRVNKPALPRLQVGQTEPGGSSSTSSLPGQTTTIRSATSTPTLPKPKIPAFIEKPPLHVKTDILGSASLGSGLSTKQRLAQTALQITTPTEKVFEPSRPLLPQKSSALSGSLSGMNFKKRPPNLKASPTITPAEMTPPVPVYSPQDVPAAAPPSAAAASSSSSSFPSASSSSLPSLPHLKEVDLPASVSRKRKWIADVETQGQGRPHPHKLQSSSMNEVHFSSINTERRVSPLRHESGDGDMIPPGALTISTPTPAPKSVPLLMDQAEKFLQSIAPFEPAHQRAVSLASSPQKPIIPLFTRRRPEKERALWTGQILLQDGNDSARIVCTEGVLMPSGSSGHQAALAHGSMPLKVAMSYKDDRLVMSSFYGVDALDGILAAFNPAQEWGWIGAGEEEETAKLGKVAEFLLAQKLVVSVPVIVENDPVALILLYPSTLGHSRFPDTTLFPPNETALIAAMYSWVLGAEDRSREQTQRHYLRRLDDARDRRDPKLPQGIYDVYSEPSSKLTEGAQPLSGFKPMLKHAARMLEFPELLHAYLVSGGDRPFALWPPTDSEAFLSSNIPQLEMKLLVSLLKEYPAAIDRGTLGVEQDMSLRAIFVHVNSLNAGSGNVKDMPNLAKYRMLNDVRFFVYGSSDIVNPRFPDITEEIWHIGGLLALTPSVLLSDPLGAYQRIQQVEEHDIWVSYTTPASIGMAVTLAYRGKEDVVKKRVACTAFEHGSNHSDAGHAFMLEKNSDNSVADELIATPCTCGGFGFEWLLEAIEDDFVSILGAPPIPASDPYCDGHGTVIHEDVVRDGKPRRKDEWEKLSSDLLAASSSITVPSSSSSIPSSNPSLPPSREIHYKNSFASWAFELFDSSVRDRHETLDLCVKEFSQLCGNVPEEEWEEVVKKELMVNLSRMAVSRGFREELRRFVVITGDNDKYLGSGKGGFEWVTAEEFRFHDGADEME